MEAVIHADALSLSLCLNSKPTLLLEELRVPFTGKTLELGVPPLGTLQLLSASPQEVGAGLSSSAGSGSLSGVFLGLSRLRDTCRLKGGGEMIFIRR